MKKTALLLATLFSASASAQLPIPQSINVPPVLLGLVPGLLPATVPLPLTVSGTSVTVNVIDRGATVTLSADPTMPLTVETFGLPGLPGLSGLP